MFGSLFNSTTIPLLQKVAAFTERRQEVLAGNIANISTPDYKSRDLPVDAFKKTLQEAITQRQQPGDPANANWSFTAAANADNTKLSSSDLFKASEIQGRGITFQDGNNRNIETEVMEMTRNSMLQNIAVELLNNQMNRLQAVISERA